MSKSSKFDDSDVETFFACLAFTPLHHSTKNPGYIAAKEAVPDDSELRYVIEIQESWIGTFTSFILH